MIKQTIEYVDFNGNERKEDFYFHLSLPEVTRLQARIGSSLTDYINELTQQTDVNSLLTFLEEVILMSYGRKTTDGKTFLKTKDIKEEFEHSQAYAELFEKLLTEPEMAKSFGEGIADNGKKKNVLKPEVVTD